MAQVLETVKVKDAGPSGYRVINKADMTKADTLWVEPKPAEKEKAK
jgi:hypothetical protein